MFHEGQVIEQAKVRVNKKNKRPLFAVRARNKAFNETLVRPPGRTCTHWLNAYHEVDIAADGVLLLRWGRCERTGGEEEGQLDVGGGVGRGSG